VLLVTRLDRLARSMRDLLDVLATIAEKGAGLANPGARDNRSRAGLAVAT
jgi:DNA invertase Pin-like site-specific DNA recombinase